jgi:hypothetical protein
MDSIQCLFFIIRRSEVSEVWNSLDRRPTVFFGLRTTSSWTDAMFDAVLTVTHWCTLQANQWLASDNCSPDGWFPDMETILGHPGLQIWQLQIFLWGYLKERIYQTKPRTVQKLKDSIRREILSIQKETLTLVMECVVRRVQHCVALRGVRLPQVIFRT